VVSDEMLARRVQQGDRAALDVLVDRHYDALVGFLYRLTAGDTLSAQDLAQETFLRVLRGIASYDAARPFKPWLYAIATHAARNRAGSASSRREIFMDDDAIEATITAPDAGSVERLLLVGEVHAAVLEAVASLPAHQRETLMLFYDAELSLAEIATLLGIPTGTVKSRLSIAVGRLREHLRRKELLP